MLRNKIMLFSTIVMCFIASAYCLNFFQADSKTKFKPQLDENSNKINIPEQSAEGDVSELWNCKFSNSIKNVVISDDGNYIATINSSTVSLFNKLSNDTIWTYEVGTAIQALTVDISWDGTYITASNNNGQTFLLNNTEKALKTEMWKYPLIISTGDYVYSAISFYGNYIVSGDSDGYVMLFNNSYSNDKQYIWRYQGIVINAIDISDDGYYIAAASNDGYIYVFNSTKTAYKTYIFRYDATSSVNLVKISKDGRYIVAKNDDNEVYLFNTTDFQGIPMWNFTTSKTSITLNDIDISGDGTYVIIGGNDLVDGGYIYLLNKTFSSGNKLAYWSHLYSGTGVPNTKSIAISRDNKYIVSGYQRGGSFPAPNCTLLFNAEKTTPKKPLWENIEGGTPSETSIVTISGLGNYFAVGFSDMSPSYKLFLFHHDVPLPQTFILLVGDDDDDEKKEAPPVIIPFGNYYLIFTVITIISLVVFEKRRII